MVSSTVSQVERGVDRLADLPESLKLARRTRQFARPGLNLLEQADVLDGDHGLVREGRDEVDLPFGEGPDIGADQGSTPIGTPSRISGDTERRAEVAEPLGLGPGVVRIVFHVRNMDDTCLPEAPVRSPSERSDCAGPCRRAQ